MQEEKANQKGSGQAKLDGMLLFTHLGVLHAMAQFVVCDDQVLFSWKPKSCKANAQR